ncbi:BamA/TamA family outer membrane protein [Ferrimonas lipolytica]|uniref:BamA/TamA family outer membrane protein n=1 Tax=Ferrimonas lipolytica TaxID=2724191 RepID=A0A6H1UJZ3_9GAMM|nr:BamA/TamA family outer membrane protein [Ferrimonas lipolytica]QIZ78122.1 BamA/TamA family outer membrane protein [Ferrimonas lipolytica]
MRYLSVILVSLLLCGAANALPRANAKYSVKRLENPNPGVEQLVLPYFFSPDSMGFNVGVGAIRKGLLQDQMSIGGTVYGGDDSYGALAGVWNYRLPTTERWFASFIGFVGDFPNQRAYGGASLVPIANDHALPGSHNSSPNDYIEGQGASNFWDVKLEYALPIGATRDDALLRYEVRNGLLVSEPTGGKVWNPLESGATVAILRQFNRYQDFNLDSGNLEGTVHGLELGLLYDNTDFTLNPSFGSRQYLSVSHDNGWLDSEEQWTFLNFEASKFFSLGESATAHQRVVALNFWTGYTPSWEVEEDAASNSRKVVGGAPYNEGARLGGFFRMRGYDNNRFHDKASIYTTAEYRHTLKYNPADHVAWFRKIRMDWVQLVGFVEAGRVGEAYTSDELLQDLHVDYGMSVRTMLAGMVVRFDLAKSDETTNFWVMAKHPF